MINFNKSSHYGPIFQNFLTWWIQNLRKTHDFPSSKKHSDKAKFRFRTLNCLLSSTKLWERGPSKNASSFLSFWPGLAKWKVSFNFELEVDIVRSRWPFFWISKALRSCREKQNMKIETFRNQLKNSKIANLISFHPKFEKYKKIRLELSWPSLSISQFLFACIFFFVEFFQIRLNADVCTRNLKKKNQRVILIRNLWLCMCFAIYFRIFL